MEKAEGPMWLHCNIGIETALVPSYSHLWLSRSGLNMTGDVSIHSVTGEKINTKCSTQWVSLLLIMSNSWFWEPFFPLPLMFIFLFVITEEKYPGKPAFKLFSPAHRWICGWAQRFGLSTQIHCCSLTSQLEGLIRVVHHCVGLLYANIFLPNSLCASSEILHQ